MCDLNKFYEEASTGRCVDDTEIINYIKSYEKVILWGASFQGKAIGKKLLEKGVKILYYWDLRYDEIKQVNNVEVIAPFSNDNNENTLIILCIGNTAIRAQLIRRLNSNGYKNILLGEDLYKGICCPFNNEIGIKANVCSQTMECRSMFCDRLHNIIKNKNDKGGLYIPNLTFMITTHCSLKCKYCVAYMNSYDNAKRKFFTYEQISNDIDNIFSVVDSVGSITIQGGEPFLHKDIDQIVKKLLEKNFGIVIIATNGIFKIDEKKIKKLANERVNVAFSGYYDALPKEKLDIYYKNIELMKKYNVQHTVGVKVPEWTIPPTLWSKNYSIEVMKRKKQNCRIPIRCMQVVNGRLYPCLFSASLHEIGIADYKNDYVNLNSQNLKEDIEKFMNQEYYDSCRHCGDGGGSTVMAGEQGFFDFVNKK
ncbi:radical SAM protein [Clostridium sp. MSJ-8]|uniref:radical SAM protein n=1 Tax=Clostridium sp. MSJ-8 TaxID=2841510 RepID=UPI001C0ED40E|nr:radical SAM protein [Clostridium sp. MSJ-8]MBU5488417.1 radical SAM protein [Clostridium sp. MSJ-8]